MTNKIILLAAGVLTALVVSRARAKPSEVSDVEARSRLLKDPIVQDLLKDQKLALTSEVRSENDLILEQVKEAGIAQVESLRTQLDIKNRRIAKLSSQEFRDYSTGYLAGQSSIRSTIRSVGTSLYGG